MQDGDIGVLGFTVLVIFEIGFLVLALKMSGFSLFFYPLWFSVFSFLNIRFSVFREKEKRVFIFCLVTLPSF